MTNPQVAEYIVDLKDENPSVRLIAAEALVKIGTPAVPALIETLTDKCDSSPWLLVQRSIVAKVLGEIRDASAVPVLIKALEEKRLRVHSNATEALINIGMPAAPALIEALKHTNSWVRNCAAYVLGKIGSASVVFVLIEEVMDENSLARSSAIKASGEIGDASAVPALIQALTNEPVRYSAISALGKIGDASAAPALIEALKKPRDCRKAVSALIKIGIPAVPALIKTLEHNEYLVRQNSSIALIEIGVPSIPTLIDALENESEAVRSGAFLILAQLDIHDEQIAL